MGGRPRGRADVAPSSRLEKIGDLTGEVAHALERTRQPPPGPAGALIVVPPRLRAA